MRVESEGNVLFHRDEGADTIVLHVPCGQLQALDDWVRGRPEFCQCGEEMIYCEFYEW